MARFENTTIWQRTLATQLGIDPASKQRERLRLAFEKFRERAEMLAGEISRSLPDFTVHDITHIDSLWDIANIVVGTDYPLTPAEGFVLGGAFLIHDLGLGIAAYPEGLEELRKNKIWDDTVAAKLRQHLGRAPTTEEINTPDKGIEIEVTSIVLRELHAKHAERLALIGWRGDSGTTDYHLIDDTELRAAYGAVIGKIAHSHWWSVDQIREQFPSQALGAPGDFPNDWTVDPTKLACILRAADACHLDDRRAPAFLRVLRRPQAGSEKHWIFQEKLYQPRQEDDRLVYTSKSDFTVEESDAWWLCYDTLKMVDRELRQVDSLLADTRRSRLAARGVSSVEEPKRLVKLVGTTNWEPVDAQIKVGNVARLIANLGGEALYGHDVLVPLRELIQNASDAVRARRILENHKPDWGDIYVRHGIENEQHWIEVEDTGIGMSVEVLTGPFLDFGTSFWGSDLMHTELPGLEAKGFTSTGKYGIGFFSVFMWGDRVQIFTRRPDKAREDTWVLEFTNGLTSRPILRRAIDRERSRDGGTRIRVWLKESKAFSTLVSPQGDSRKWTFDQRLAWLCPALDVNLHCADQDKEHDVISASDWITIKGIDLIKRIKGPVPAKALKRINPTLSSLSNNLRLISGAFGEVLGRAAVYWGVDAILPDSDEDFFFYDALDGVVTVGGLRSSELNGIVGILAGTPSRASRDTGIPFAEHQLIFDWACEQSSLLKSLSLDEVRLQSAASYLRALGYTPSDIPIAYHAAGWKTFDDIVAMDSLSNEILLYPHGYRLFKDTPDTNLYDNVLLIEIGSPFILQTSINTLTPLHFWPQSESSWEDSGRDYFLSRSLYGAVLEAIAQAWKVSVEDVLESLRESGTGLDKHEIGISDGKPVLESVFVLKKPSNKRKRAKTKQ